jgi:hypothetical protein
LAEDYASTFSEVRSCRRSIDHDLRFVRVLANPGAMNAYQGRSVPFEPGAIVVKEEYDGADSVCHGPVQGWTVMRRDQTGWGFQRLTSARQVSPADPRCASCHAACGVPPDGYEGTCASP